jgi:prepilin-type processing-associated H-X9-DG protein
MAMTEKESSSLGTALRIAVAVTAAVVAFAILAQGVVQAGIFGARESARRSACLNNLKQLGLALKVYSQDYREIYPWQTGTSDPKNAWLDLGLLFPSYNSGWDCFRCPSSKDKPFEPMSASGEKKDYPFEPLKPADNTEVISYAYGLDASDADKVTAWTENAPSTVRLLADKKAGWAIEDESKVNPTAKANHHADGRNVLYQDGHVKWKPGGKPLDPDETDDEIGKPDAPDYSAWWSDPPFYREGTEEEAEDSGTE